MVSLDSVYWDLDALRGAKASNQRCVCVRRHLVRICKPCAHKKSHAFFVKDTASLGRAGLELKDINNSKQKTYKNTSNGAGTQSGTYLKDLTDLFDVWPSLSPSVRAEILSIIGEVLNRA